MLPFRRRVPPAAKALAALLCVGPSTLGDVQFLTASRTVSATVSPFNRSNVRPEDTVTDQFAALGPVSLQVQRRLPDPPASPAQFASASQQSDFGSDDFVMHAVLEYDDAMLSTRTDSRAAFTSAVLNVAFDRTTPWRLDMAYSLTYQITTSISHRILIRDSGGTVLVSRLVGFGSSTTFSGELPAGQYVFELPVQAGSTTLMPSLTQARYEFWQRLILPSPCTGTALAALALVTSRRRRSM